MDTNIDSFSVLPITEAKVLKISYRKHTDRMTFLSIHFKYLVK